MAVPRARLLSLMKAQCEIFSTTYNPDGIRMGNKILRQRLRGPSLAKYYPPRGPSLNELLKDFKHLELEGVNEEFEDWQEHIAGFRASTRKAAAEEEENSPSCPERGKK
ncbi:mitochondrial 37S ribosomal protein mS33 [Apiospora aurea]|uniref:Small ribosomal subunit protein mS33 n=1 Tax=Apiospora aurea TaxID=335848 RepID=A0ABR1Q881_9PEZI